MKNRPHILFLMPLITFIISFSAFGGDRNEEIKTMMWGDSDKDFQCTEIPQKWQNESVVIIAQMNRFEYKKPPIISELRVNKYFHKRLKLNDKNAIESYSEMSYPSGDGRLQIVYSGFKLIKADGREIVIDLSKAVEMEMEENGRKLSYKKIAIPNLEEGDILDYYICEDRIIPTYSKMYYFEPVQYYLPHEYPVIKQKLEFDVQRRCFISLRSMNGAPEMKLVVDEENDSQHYLLEDRDREAVKDIRWFYPYRVLPTIKFRAAYSSGNALRQNDVLLGEPGTVKNSVSKKELCDFVSYLITNTFVDPREVIKHVKKNTDNASNFEKAKAGYYYCRNRELKYDEARTVADRELSNAIGSNTNSYRNEIHFLDEFSGFLARMDIPYDIVIAIPRYLSSLDDLLLEHELQFLIRVKQGNEYLYLSPYDNFSMAGRIDSDLQGAEAYVVDGLANFKDWDPKRITIPVSDKLDSKESGDIVVNISEDFSKANLSVKRTVSGNFKASHQRWLLDYYDYEEEEQSRYEMPEDFAGMMMYKKKLLTLRESYLANRDKTKQERLQSLVEAEYDFKIDTISDLSIEETGRYEPNPTMIYSFNMQTEDLVSKVGGNYLLSVGKLIEKQVKIEEDELEREYGVYLDHPRSYNYKVAINIPNGFEVKGLENLNKKVETPQGGFESTAKVENGQLLIETVKHYDLLEAKKEEWPQMVKFLNAAHQFTEQKILFKRL